MHSLYIKIRSLPLLFFLFLIMGFFSEETRTSITVYIGKAKKKKKEDTRKKKLTCQKNNNRKLV